MSKTFGLVVQVCFFPLSSPRELFLLGEGALQRVLLTLCRPTMECTANFKGLPRTMPPGCGRWWRRLAAERERQRARTARHRLK